MRQIWKWTAIAGASVVVLGIVGIVCLYIGSERIISRTYPLPTSRIHASTDPAVIALGRHLVRLYGCADCHRPNLQGTYIAEFGMSSRNLIRLAASFSDADFDRAIRRGLRRDGTSVAETMPSDSFQYMRDTDVVAVISYIRSFKPAGPDIPAPSYSLKDRWAFLRGLRKTTRDWFPLQKPALNLGPKYERARQTAMTACGECHGTSLEGQSGGPLPPPNLTIAAS